jgi:TonB family protein
MPGVSQVESSGSPDKLARRQGNGQPHEMKSVFLLVGSLGLAGAAVPAPSAAPEPRTSTQKWVLDFADQQCVASREYGTADEPLVLVLKPSPLGDVVQMSLITKATNDAPRETDIDMTIDSDPAIRIKGLAFNSTRAKFRSIRINLPVETAARLARATRLSVTAVGELSEAFLLSQMPALMPEMDRCMVDLKRHWNIDETSKAKLRSRVQGNLAQYFTGRDYPELAIQKQRGGSVKFALLIDETGKVADCTVTASSSVPVLDAQSCGILMTRARFKPAVGADGKPAKDAVGGTVSWRMSLNRAR